MLFWKGKGGQRWGTYNLIEFHQYEERCYSSHWKRRVCQQIIFQVNTLWSLRLNAQETYSSLWPYKNESTGSCPSYMQGLKFALELSRAGMQVTWRIGAGASYQSVKDLFVKWSYNFLRVYNLLVQLLLPMSPQAGRLWRSRLLMYTVDFIYKRKKKFWLNPLAKLALVSFYPPILHLRIEPFFFFSVSKSVLFIWF